MSQDRTVISKDCNESFFSEMDSDNGFAHWKIFCVGVSDLQGEYIIERTFTNQHIVVHTLEGEGHLYQADGSIEKLLPGNALWIPSNTAFHYQASDKGWKTVWFLIKEDAIWSNFPSKLTLKYHERGWQWHDLMGLLIKEKLQRDEMAEQSISLYCQQLFLLLQRSLIDLNSIEQQASQRMRKLFLMIEADPKAAWPIEKMCLITNYSKAHLFRLTKQLFGCSPSKKVAEIRMQKATVLLTTTNLSIQQIAFIVGFDNAFNFSTRFKQLMGVSPSQYRIK